TRVAASLLQLRGLFALSSGQLDDALEAFNDFLRQVIETHETQREGVAHFHLGKALDAMGRSDEALASFQQAIRLLAERQLTLELLNALEAFAGMLARHSAYEPSCLVCAVTAATRERMGYRPGDQANAARSAALGPAEQAIDSQTLARITGTGRVTPLTALVGWTAAAEMRRDAASGTTQIWLPASP
ncbi:MAG: tetratricopeptide repeat protein, partial [Betaproteobacteria bacterium]|nr:tetratricopeptide repeat protein [Betaproteobacteria bacterium]